MTLWYVKQAPYGTLILLLVNLGSCALSIQFRNTTSISHRSVNTYVISTWGEEVVIRCQGKAAVQSRLARGLENCPEMFSYRLGSPPPPLPCVIIVHSFIHA